MITTCGIWYQILNIFRSRLDLFVNVFYVGEQIWLPISIELTCASNAIGVKRDANNKMSVSAQSNLVKVLDFSSSHMMRVCARETERKRARESQQGNEKDGE